MTLLKSSFIKNYKDKVKKVSPNVLEDAVHHAFYLTDKYGIAKISLAISEASIKYNLDEDVLRNTINDVDFIIENLGKQKGVSNE
jgi:hypothetical protein